MNPSVKAFFDKDTWTLTYIAYDPQSKDAVIIDPVWDYDPATSKLSTQSTKQVKDYILAEKLKVHFILETHAHADHVSGAQVLKKDFPQAKIGIGANITEVQKVFKNVFNLKDEFKTNGTQFDILLDEKNLLFAGTLLIKTIFTPGHTPACSTFIIGDAVFVGDTIFMPDYGTGRCDFPAGNANELYNSITEKLFKLPDNFRVFVGHDYMPNGREVAFESTIGEEKNKNIQINLKITREKFVEFRQSRDKNLAAPRLLLPSVQININGGKLPAPEENGNSYLKIPIRIN